MNIFYLQAKFSRYETKNNRKEPNLGNKVDKVVFSNVN